MIPVQQQFSPLNLARRQVLAVFFPAKAPADPQNARRRAY
jgi:hypothetical protein